jgi:nucleotide-binding universal stress UspA family protein
MKITKILLPTDFSELSNKATDYAHELAKQYGAAVVMMYVVDNSSNVPGGWYVPHISMDEMYKDMEKNAEKRLEKCCYETFRDLKNVERVVVKGVPEVEIIKYASENGVDMIIMGSETKKGMDVVFGSTAERVIRKAGCPVLCVKES